MNTRTGHHRQSRNSNWESGPWFLLVIIAIAVAFAVFGVIRNDNGDSSWFPGVSRWWLLLSALGLAVVTLVLGVWWYLRKIAIAYRRNQEALSLLEAGDVAAASRMWERIIADESERGVVRATALCNRGVALLRLGLLEEAQRSFDVAVSQRFLATSEPSIKTLVNIHQVLCYALQGNLIAASECRQRVEARGLACVPGLLLLGNTVLGLRSKQHTIVLQHLAEEHTHTEGEHGTKALRLLCAFGHSQLPDAPEHAEHIEQMLANVRPFRPGEFDYLVGNWPEFRVFLERNGFVAASEST